MKSQEKPLPTLRSSLAPCFPGHVPNSWSSVSQVSWTRAVVPTNAVKGRGSRHFSRLAMTRRMIGAEVWRSDRYKLWGERLGFDASKSDVQDGRESRREGRVDGRHQNTRAMSQAARADVGPEGSWRLVPPLQLEGCKVTPVLSETQSQNYHIGPESEASLRKSYLVPPFRCKLKLIGRWRGTRGVDHLMDGFNQHCFMLWYLFPDNEGQPSMSCRHYYLPNR